MAHPVIKKEVQELLARTAVEPLTGAAGFYSSVSVVLSVLVVDALFSVLSNLIAICTYLLLGYLLLKRYGNLFNKVITISPFI